MPSKRTRISRLRRLEGPSPAELQWLTGKPQEGANRFWKFTHGAEKVARCRALIESCGNLIPRGRLGILAQDLAFWGESSRKKR